MKLKIFRYTLTHYPSGLRELDVMVYRHVPGTALFDWTAGEYVTDLHSDPLDVRPVVGMVIGLKTIGRFRVRKYSDFGELIELNAVNMKEDGNLL